MSVITITKAAANHIKKAIADKEGAIGFRVSIKKTGCSGYMYVPSILTMENPDDIKVTTEFGVTIYIDSKYESIFKGTEIDYKAKELGQSLLVFNNPNVDSECGCGESFGLKDEQSPSSK